MSKRYRKHKTGLTICLTWMLWLSPSWAKEPYLHTHHWDSEDGLSQNEARTLVQDQAGFIWIGTHEGLNRFDGFNFRVYRAGQGEGLSSNLVMRLFIDSQQRLWVGTQKGMNLYDAEMDRFRAFTTEDGLPDDFVIDIDEGPSGQLWVATIRGAAVFNGEGWERPEGAVGASNGLILDLKATRDRTWVIDAASELSAYEGDQQISFLLDRDAPSTPVRRTFGSNARHVFQWRNQLFVMTREDGLYEYLPSENQFRVWNNMASSPVVLPDHRYQTAEVDDKGDLWLASTEALIHITPDLEKRVFTYQENFNRDLNANVRDIMVDREGLLWLGLDDGVYSCDLESTRFGHYRNFFDQNPQNNKIEDLAPTGDGRLLIAAGGAMGFMDPDSKSFTPVPESLRTQMSSPDYLFAAKANERWWFATNRGRVWVWDPQSNDLEQLPPFPKNPITGGDMRPINLVVDRAGLIWILGEHSGLSTIDPETKQFLRRNDPTGSADRDVFLDMVDYNDGRWFGGVLGLTYLPYEGGEARLFSANNGPNSLNNSAVNTLLVDRSNQLWVGTFNGLHRYQPDSRDFVHFGEAEGLPNAYIYTMQEDNLGFLWLATNKGLARMDPLNNSFRAFSTADGLQADEFNRASLKLPDGRLVFAGDNGLNLFDPTAITTAPRSPSVLLTRFLNRNVEVRPEVGGLLPQSITMEPDIILNHDHTLFSVEFSLPSYRNPRAHRYAYQLEGLDEDWVETDWRQRSAAFTRLDPGAYVLRVRAAGEGDNWSEETQLTIQVIASPWRSPLAYFVYGLLALSLVLVYVRRQKRMLDHQMKAVEQLRRLNRMKNDFLKNTSRELRAPLNGIIGLVDAMSLRGDLDTGARQELEIIAAGGKRLDRLVRDILDYTALREGELLLDLKPLELTPIADATLNIARYVVHQESITLERDIPDNLPPILADEPRLHQILWNLVDNAAKYTVQGSIKISARHLPKKDLISIRVSDTGIGMSPEKRDRLMESFAKKDVYVTGSAVNSGMGLSLAHALLISQGGSLSLTSKEGKGTAFTFTLPRSTESADAYVTKQSPLDPSTQAAQSTVAQEPKPQIQAPYHILIADDQSVNRVILRGMLLSNDYRITLVENGHQAMEVFERERVDLLLVDTMMPGLSGYSVCQQLREKYDASELPIIFMTNRRSNAELNTVFLSGGSDYLIKPIAREELVGRVSSHLKLLDFHRAMEEKVQARTRELEHRGHELEKKNRELEIRYRELDTMDTIVRTVNREIKFSNLVHVLLEQARHVFPSVQRVSFATFESGTHVFRVVDSVGERAEELKGKDFDISSEANDLWPTINVVEKGLYLVKPECIDRHPGQPAARMSIDISAGQQIQALMCLDHLENPEGLNEVDAHRLVRFREHARSAVIKARYISDMLETQKGLVEEAHQAGMAEIAAGVMHNMGNNLNSIKTSVHVMEETFLNTKHMDFFAKLNASLARHADDLSGYLGDPKRGKQVTRALTLIHTEMTKTWNQFRGESKRLLNQVDGMTRLLREQHQYTSTRGRMYELIDLNQLVEDALRREGLLIRKSGVELVFSPKEIPRIRLERVKTMRMILFMLRNAREAVEGIKDNPRIELSVQGRLGGVVLIIRDNGSGVTAEHQERVFAQGFTTKKDRQGMGLHYAANVVQDAGGEIMLKSDGAGKGAEFTIIFPIEDPTIQ